MPVGRTRRCRRGSAAAGGPPVARSRNSGESPARAKEEPPEAKEEPPVPGAVDLGAQSRRWAAFLQQHRLSSEEAAQLLLDALLSYRKCPWELGEAQLRNLHPFPVHGTSETGRGSECKSLVKHTGGCHCGAVRFEVWASADLHVFNCNCSICTKKQNRHFIVPALRFKLLQGADNLTTYTFNTHRAKHMFCKTCGVQSFYIPRSNPDGYGIAPHCLDDGTVQVIITEDINGKEWEEAVRKHKTIRDMSKP
ncbi:centromere protein V isoform X1 [Taeniopygia guttata]|uniref:centromere protein V isoform X1 n=1 Tax=Taeniopygia guttata TaxID=59729 RepID=UPI003BB924FA